MEQGGLMYIQSRGVMCLEDKLVCSFKLAAIVVRGGVWQFVYDTYRPAILKGDLAGFCVNDNW